MTIPAEFRFAFLFRFLRAFSKMLYPGGHENVFLFNKSFVFECHVSVKQSISYYSTKLRNSGSRAVGPTRPFILRKLIVRSAENTIIKS